MCSIFVKRLNEQIIVGRNFDWIQQQFGERKYDL